LVDITHEQELFASKGLTHISRIDAKNLVDKVDNISPDHRDFVDDNQLNLPQQLTLCAGVFQRFLDVAAVIARVVGQERMEGQLEEAVERLSASIDGCDARGSEDDIFLLGVL
jgi:hypothetical protein